MNRGYHCETDMSGCKERFNRNFVFFSTTWKLMDLVVFDISIVGLGVGGHFLVFDNIPKISFLLSECQGSITDGGKSWSWFSRSPAELFRSSSSSRLDSSQGQSQLCMLTYENKNFILFNLKRNVTQFVAQNFSDLCNKKCFNLFNTQSKDNTREQSPKNNHRFQQIII